MSAPTCRHSSDGIPRRILLAGASGVIGRSLVPLLLEAGHHVSATTRRPDRAEALWTAGATPIVLDVFDAAAVDRAVGEAAPDVIVHQLTDLSARDSGANARLRREGTANLTAAAGVHGVERMVAQSISWAYAPGDAPAVESDPLDLSAAEPRLTTVSAVAALEQAVLGLPRGVVLRYGTLYGPGTWYAADGMIAEQLHGGSLRATADVSCLLHVADAAAAAVAALDWPAGTVNVVDEEPASGLDWLPAFAAAVGAPAPDADADAPAAGRAVSGALAAERGLALRYPSWRTGFETLRG